MSSLQFLSFIAGTLFIIWFSWWASIKEKRFHGIYRFFAFESILLMTIQNLALWFHDPFSIVQIISWMLLLLSIYLALFGFYHLVERGKPKGKFENTSLLVITGLYKYIRHPLYCSLLLLGTGIWLKNPANYLSYIPALINLIALYFTAREEENEMKKRFGSEYLNYCRKSKMFIPFIF